MGLFAFLKPFSRLQAGAAPAAGQLSLRPGHLFTPITQAAIRCLSPPQEEISRLLANPGHFCSSRQRQVPRRTAGASPGDRDTGWQGRGRAFLTRGIVWQQPGRPEQSLHHHKLNPTLYPSPVHYILVGFSLLFLFVNYS